MMLRADCRKSYIVGFVSGCYIIDRLTSGTLVFCGKG